MKGFSAFMRKWSFITAVSMVLMTAVLSCVLRAEAAEENAVRVGYSVAGSMLRKEEDGCYTGYNAMYLYEIARYTGWHYEFVPFTNWSDAISALENGEIDILPTVVKTPERENTMLFPEENMGKTPMAVVGGQNSRFRNYGDVQALQGARIGVRRDTADAEKFEKWAQRSAIRYTEAVYDNRDMLLEALDKGEIDYAATSYVGAVCAYPELYEYGAEEMYFAVAKNRPGLLMQLERALKDIEHYDDPFAEILREETGHNGESTLKLSAADRAFIATHAPIRVSICDEGAPFSDWENDEARGAVPAFLKRISERTGLQFTFVKVDSRTEELQLLHEGKIDMIGNLAWNLYYAEKHDIRLTTSYAVASLSGIMRESSSGDVVGVTEANFTQLRGKPEIEGKEVRVFSGLRELMLALETGEVDVIYCSNDKAGYFMNARRHRGYSIFTLPKSTANQTFATRKDEDPRLCRILDGTISDIAPSEFPPMLREAHADMPVTLETMVERLSGGQLLAFGFILLMVCLGSMALTYYANRSKKIEKRVAAFERERLQAMEYLSVEKKLNAAQFDFFNYMDGHLRKPMGDIYRYAQRQGGIEPESPFHPIYALSSETVMLFNRIRLFNNLNARSKQPVWKETDPHEFLEHLERVTDWLLEKQQIRVLWDINVAAVALLMETSLMSLAILQVLDNMRLRMADAGTIRVDCSMNDVYGGRVVLRVVLSSEKVVVPGDELAAVRKFIQTTQAENRSIYEGFSDKDAFKIEHQTLLRAAIIQLAMKTLGGEWNIDSGSKGTQVEMDFYFDRA